MVLVVKRWVAVASLSTLFAVGAGVGWFANGWWLDGPALAARNAPARTASPSSRPPTPGGWYRIEPNDTLSEVSQRAYGTTRRVNDLLAANPGVDPARVRAGSLLYVPLVSDGAPASAPASAAPRPVR